MGDLIPGAKLIYERVDDTVYARYRDAPHNKIPRWEVGGSPKQMELFDHWEFEEMMKASKKSLKIKTKIVSHLKIDVPVYSSNQLPDTLRSVPITTPGSRFIK